MQDKNSRQQLFDQIQQHVATEAVFLIASGCIQYHHNNLFYGTAASFMQPDAYLLLTIADVELRQCKIIQSKLENVLQAIASVTVWCMPLSQFNEQLFKNEYFACSIWKQAERLLIKADASFAAPSLPTVPHDCQQEWYQRASAFFAGAELFIIRKQYTMAAFHLHQCAEQAFTSIVYNACGYRPATHNLQLLYRYACWFALSLHSLFPDTNLNEKHLLDLLQAAYTGSRYAHDYHVKGEQIMALKKKVEVLLGEAAEGTGRRETEVGKTGRR